MFVLATNVIKGRTEGTALFFELTTGLALSAENGRVDLVVMLSHADLNIFFYSILRRLDPGNCFEWYIIKSQVRRLIDFEIL